MRNLWSFITIALIVGLFIWGRRSGKNAYAAAILQARLDGKAEAIAEVNADVRQAVNVQVGQAAGVGALGSDDFEAFLEYRRIVALRGPGRDLGSGGSADVRQFPRATADALGTGSGPLVAGRADGDVGVVELVERSVGHAD